MLSIVDLFMQDIIDLDGTCLDNPNVSQVMTAEEEALLPEHYENAEPYHDIVRMIHSSPQGTLKTIITGRKYKYKDVTEGWVDKHVLPGKAYEIQYLGFKTYALYIEEKVKAIIDIIEKSTDDVYRIFEDDEHVIDKFKEELFKLSLSRDIRVHLIHVRGGKACRRNFLLRKKP